MFTIALWRMVQTSVCSGVKKVKKKCLSGLRGSHQTGVCYSRMYLCRARSTFFTAVLRALMSYHRAMHLPWHHSMRTGAII